MEILYRDGALADGQSDRLALGMSILVRDGTIAWIRPTDDEGPAADDAIVVDASGSAFVSGMVDAHSHLALPGGAHWIQRIDDPPERLLAHAEANAHLLTHAGVRWARDVGAPRVTDPVDGTTRAITLGIRERWRGRRQYPYVRAAGTWLDKAGTIPGSGLTEAKDADELLSLARRQLDEGADLLKLYLDGPEPGVSPWSIDEVRPVVDAAHERGRAVTAHSTNLGGARVGIAAGVDSIEHGFEIDTALAADMAARGARLVSTLSIFRSRMTFRRTTAIPRFASDAGAKAIVERLQQAEESVRIAHAAGVAIAAGTDFGGGSTRANQLAWEVESLVAAGLEPWEALGAATWRGGELLGEPDAGVIREGGPADFFLVHGDPLSDPSALWRPWHIAWVAGLA